MDSEVDLSLLAPLTAYNSVKTELKNLRRGKSTYTIWVHTYMAYNGENSWHKFCIHCTVILLYSTSVSINMRRHLKSKYGIYVD